MNTNELYLKTAFACMACDGEIDDKELQLVKHFAQTSKLFDGLDVKNKLNEYVEEINEKGKIFLTAYVSNIANAPLSEEQELKLVEIAIKMIEADNKIEYSEISFFKRIRNKLKVSDEKILDVFKNETLFEKFPEIEPEDFLLPDIIVDDDANWSVSFENIELNTVQ